MRVLIVTNLFPLPNDPTRGIFNYQQFSHLPQDLNCLVLVPVPWRLWQAPFAEVMDFGRMRVRYFRFLYPPRLGRGLHHYWMWLSLFMSALADVDRFEPQCVLGCFLYPDGSLAAKLSARYRVPLVLKAHGTDVNVKAVDPQFRKRIEASVRRSSCLVAVADSLADRIREIPLPARQIKVVENGIDLDMFRLRDRAPSRLALKLDPQSRLVLYVGNLKRDKGCLDLFDAALTFLSQVPHSLLLYVGDGECMMELRNRIDQAGLQDRILLHGRKRHEEVPMYLSAADVLVLPSYAEGLPNVVLEAFASGRPVVGTSVGAMPSLLAAGRGVLVPPREPQQLADGIVSVLESQYDEQRLRAFTESRSWAASAAALGTVLRNAYGPATS